MANSSFGDPHFPHYPQPPYGYDIILCWGQSNIIGRDAAGPDPVFDKNISDLYHYDGTNNPQPIAEPIPHMFPGGPDAGPGVGPGGPFARAYIRDDQNKRRKVLLVGNGRSATPLVAVVGTTWNSGVNGNLFDQAVARANAAVAEEPGSRVVAILWMQGGSDGIAGESQANYEAALDALIASARAEITGAANVPFIIVPDPPEIATGTMPAIRAALAGTPSRVANTYHTDGPLGYVLGDGLHYNNAGQRLAAASMYARYLQSRYGGTTSLFNNLGAATYGFGKPEGLALAAGRWYSPYEFNSSGLGTESFAYGNDFTAGRTCTITSIACSLSGTPGSAGALVRLGLYRFNPDTYAGILVADFGTVAADSIGVKTANGSAPVVAGQSYLIVGVTQGAAVTKPTYSATAGIAKPWIGEPTATAAFTAHKGYAAAGLAGALPATATFAPSAGTNVPIFALSAAA